MQNCPWKKSPKTAFAVGSCLFHLLFELNWSLHVRRTGKRSTKRLVTFSNFHFAAHFRFESSRVIRANDKKSVFVKTWLFSSRNGENAKRSVKTSFFSSKRYHVSENTLANKQKPFLFFFSFCEKTNLVTTLQALSLSMWHGFRDGVHFLSSAKNVFPSFYNFSLLGAVSHRN